MRSRSLNERALQEEEVTAGWGGSGVEVGSPPVVDGDAAASVGTQLSGVACLGRFPAGGC